MKRTASAHWNGTLMEGTGELSTQSTVLNNTQYSFKTRFADGIGTNPEELIAAALAGCFSMALSATLAQKGFTAGAPASPRLYGIRACQSGEALTWFYFFCGQIKEVRAGISMGAYSTFS